MKIKLGLLLLVTSLVSANTLAAPATTAAPATLPSVTPVPYFKAAVALADADGLDTGISVVLNMGLPVPTVHPNFAIEGEITKSVVDPSKKVTFFGEKIESETSYLTVGGYGIYRHPISPTLHVYGRGGLIYLMASSEVKFTEPGFPVDKIKVKDSDIELSLGLGLEFALGSGTSMIVDITSMNEDLIHLSGGIKFNF